MRTLTLVFVAIAASTLAGAAYADVSVGMTAPSFSATDANGKTVNLTDFKGKYVVLEWFNPACPFTRKHYATGNMSATQAHAVEKGAAWLSIYTSDHSNSAAPALGFMRDGKAAPTAILLDQGKIARAYGAKTTPHMYIIDPAGKLVYMGGIDNKMSVNPADIPTSINYVKQAMDELNSGKPVSMSTTRPYGCSVKYASAD